MVQNQSKEEIEEELQILVVWAQQTAVGFLSSWILLVRLIENLELTWYF